MLTNMFILLIIAILIFASASCYFPDSELVLCDSIEDCLDAVSSGNATCSLISPDTYYAYRNEFESLSHLNISNTGYQISISFAKLLRKVVPLNYFVERFGGDEFIVIAENISGREEAEELIQKIRDMILKFNGLRVK